MLSLLAVTASLPLPAQSRAWLPTWGFAVMPLQATSGQASNLPIGKAEVTIRQVVHISQGGKRMRISFSNEFGTTPLRIEAAHVAFQSAASRVLVNTDRALTFSGQPSVVIAPGHFLSSDPVVERVPIFSDLVISMVLPAQAIPSLTYHAAAHTTTYLATGNHVSAEQFLPPTTAAPGLGVPNVKAPLAVPLSANQMAQQVTTPRTDSGFGTSSNADVLQTTSWYFLKNVEVNRTGKSRAVITLGDSITDGTGSTTELNARWPDVLATRLAAYGKTAASSVVNVGIGGNRILREGTGPSALDRFDRDVLSQPNARYVLMLEGINDIGNMHRSPADAVTAQQLINALSTLAARAHAHGIRFIAATILPYGGAQYYSADGDQIRQEVNDFLRTSASFDGCIDFDKVMRDPQHPDRLLPKYDHGDHLHPSDAGYAAMGAAVDLKLLRKK